MKNEEVLVFFEKNVEMPNIKRRNQQQQANYSLYIARGHIIALSLRDPLTYEFICAQHVYIAHG
jgi:hypothetical protein